MRNEGKAEFKTLLYRYGKFPLFEENWKPSDFNVIKALKLGLEGLLDFDVKSGNSTYILYKLLNANKTDNNADESIRNVLNVDFDLSKDLISEISSDYKDYKQLKYVR